MYYKSIFLIGLSFAWSLLNAQESLLSNFLSAPYTSELVKNAKGDKIAWVENKAGALKIFVANAPNYTPTSIWSYAHDIGLPLSNLQFSRDDVHLYAVVGSGVNREGVIANPASLVHYPQQTLFRVHISSAKLDTIGHYSNIVLSENGAFGLMAKGKSIWRIDLQKMTTELILTARGGISQLAISPDDKSIVFTSNRGDHSFIGHYTFGQESIKWLSPSVDKDMYPQFSPSGEQVTFVRQPGDDQDDLSNLTGGIMFSIVVHDLISGKAQTIWSSPKDDGGFAQYYPSHPLLWLKSDQILFYSEHEAFMKLYLMLPDGSQLKTLISGDCEVEQLDVSSDGQTIVFNSNKDDIDRRDLFSYAVSSGILTPLTTSTSIETDPLVMANSDIIYREADYRSFPKIVRKSAADKSSMRSIISTDPAISNAALEHVMPEQVIFRAQDGTTVHGQLFVKDRDARNPAVIFMHGGPIRQMLLGYHYSSYYANAYAFNQYLANQGYVVLSINFRSGIGYGRDFRRAKFQGPRGATEYQDILAGAAYLRDLDFVDAERLGLWGGSYGGYLTAQGLARNSNIFKAGVDLHGVHDWAWRAREFSPGGGWGLGPDDLALAYASSPISDISGWTSPVLFVHGDDDRNVMFGQTIDLVRRLREKGVDHEIVVFPDEVHGFYRYQSWFRTFKAAEDFFDRKLKN